MLLSLFAGLAHASVLRHAVIVGANDGGGVLEPLRYAEQDADRFAEVLTDIGGFAAEHVTVLHAPTSDALRAALADHGRLAADHPDDLFVLYYSGHADARGLRLGSELVSYADLKASFRAVPAEVRVGVLDACRSGAITRLKGATLSEPLFADAPLAAEGEAWMTAASADEVAQESEALRGGFFTHYLVSGLRGAADAGDGVVDLTEAYRYTFDRVVEHTGGTDAGPQHPWFEYKLTGAGDVGLTDVRDASATLVLPRSVDGLVAVVRLPDRVQVAELTKATGTEKRLAVAPGRYLVRRRTPAGLEEVTVGVAEGAQLVVDRFAPVSATVADARGPAAPTEPPPPSGAPLIAGASSIVPGGGQIYNGQPFKAAVYFGSTAALLSGAAIAAPDGVRPNLAFGLGLGLWTAAVADALHHADPRRHERPITGVTVSTGLGWAEAADVPWAAAVTADAIVRDGLSIGLDRVGVIGVGDAGSALHAGSRLMLAWEWGRLRPGAFAAVGIRHGDTLSGDLAATRFVYGGGVDVRYYVTPRWFLDGEARFEQDARVAAAATAIGCGVHFGR